jgi:RNA-directed DNA polymerase
MGKLAVTDRHSLPSLRHSFTLDFVVFCESKEDAEQAKITLTEWLGKRGLTLSKEKTQIVHRTQGFDFLGFNIRHYKAQTSKSGYKLLIKPSNKSVLTIRKKLRIEWLQAIGSNALAVIKRLNPIIRGWVNYFRIGVAKKIFSGLDHWMFRREQRYASRTHPTKSWTWKHKQYWGRINLEEKITGCLVTNTRGNIFSDLPGSTLEDMPWFRAPILQTILV